MSTTRETTWKVQNLMITVESLIDQLLAYFTIRERLPHDALHIDILRRFIFVDYEHVLQEALSIEQQHTHDTTNLQKELQYIARKREPSEDMLKVEDHLRWIGERLKRTSDRLQHRGETEQHWAFIPDLSAAEKERLRVIYLGSARFVQAEIRRFEQNQRGGTAFGPVSPPTSAYGSTVESEGSEAGIDRIIRGRGPEEGEGNDAGADAERYTSLISSLATPYSRRPTG